MYKTASQYLGNSNNKPISHLMEPYKNITQTRENFVYTPPRHYIHPTHPEHKRAKVIHSQPDKPNKLDMKWETKYYKNLSDPSVWGPAFWFSLHVGAASYPLHPSRIVKERMKGYILAIPFVIPCPGCKPHATAYIEKHRHRLDEITGSRKELFKFWVDMHNQVNKRFGKPIMSVEDAYKLYTGGAKISTLKY